MAKPNTSIYRTEVQPPPGQIVAPNGFPADPRPVGAPQTFLDAMSIRIDVFCVEQKCAIEPELDEDDPRSWSWVIYESPAPTPDSDATASTIHEIPVSTIRIVPPPHVPHPNGFHDPDEEPYVKLTRVATVAEARGKGLGKKLCETGFKYLADRPDEVGHGWQGMVLTHAQVSVQKMYERMGFVTDERLGVWDEEGIDHVGMWRRLEVKK